MHIAHVQGIFSPEHGGPAQSLSNYCIGQAAAGHRVDIWALEGFPNTSPAIRLPAPIKTHVFSVDGPAKLGGSTLMRAQMGQSQPADVYHLHGAWLRAMSYGAATAKRHRRPYVLEVMGMYEPWALNQKWLQKRLVRWWFQDRILHEAACLHVNSPQEATYLRKVGFKAPIAVIPVGVDLTAIEQRIREIRRQTTEDRGQNSDLQSSIFNLQPRLDGRPFFLYLSRLHPKKGLDLLIRSWANIQKAESGKRKTENWRLVIAGTGAPEYTQQCRHLAEQLGVADQCLWLGHVSEQEKSWLFSQAHCYVLPTSSENFGNVVAEALAHGTPVITTIHTPWNDLTQHRCGWLVDNTETELSAALTEAMQMDGPTRNAMSEAGKKLVRERYSLDFVLGRIENIYRWTTGREPQPEWITVP